MYSTLQMLDKLVAEATEAPAKSNDCFMFDLSNWKAVMDGETALSKKEVRSLSYTSMRAWFLQCRLGVRMCSQYASPASDTARYVPYRSR
jgi:hypothetical protein